MRQEDFQNALDHMINAHANGITQVDYLRSCIAPKRPEVNETATKSNNVIDESNTESLENVQKEAKSDAEESKSETIPIAPTAAASLALKAESSASDPVG